MTAKRFTIGDRALQEVYKGCIPAILDEGIPCTQSEVLKLLNELYEENEQLNARKLNIEVDRDYFRTKASSLEDGYLQLQDKEIRLKKENEQLKREKELLSDELEQCKAVIDNRWKEYLDKKGDVE